LSVVPGIIDTAKGAVKSVGKAVKGLVDSAGELFDNAASTIGRKAKKLGRSVILATRYIKKRVRKVVRFFARNVDLGKLGRMVEKKAKQFGEQVVKLGAIVEGIASDTWSVLKKFVSCLNPSRLMCDYLLGSVTDCRARGSSVSVGVSPVSLDAKFALSRGDFGKNLALSMSRGRLDQSLKKGSVASGKRSSSIPPLRAQAKLVKRSSMCTADLLYELEGDVEWTPEIAIVVQPVKNKLRVSVKAELTVSLAAFVSTKGTCAASFQLRLPKTPLMKLACAGAFCLLLAVQAVATLDISGAIDGAIELGLAADFGVNAAIEVDIGSGKADTVAESVKLRYQEAWELGGSFNGKIVAAAGPHLVVFPIPGVPVDILPEVRATLAARGAVRYPDLRTSSNKGICPGADLAISGSTEINAVGLPKGFELDTRRFKDLIMDAVSQNAQALISAMTLGNCFGPIDKVVRAALEKASQIAKRALDKVIPDLSVNLGVKGNRLLRKTLFCKAIAQVGECRNSVC